MRNSLLSQIVDLISDGISLEAARRIVAIRADEVTQAKLDSLADKANLGILTESEKADYDRVLVAIHFVSLLQARARSLLRT